MIQSRYSSLRFNKLHVYDSWCVEVAKISHKLQTWLNGSEEEAAVAFICAWIPVVATVATQEA
jgi:hypothetical protein